MKIIHTADLHIGQKLYYNYPRHDEHDHFFRQLLQWCVDEQPDALVVSGDVFDMAKPMAGAIEQFNEAFAAIREAVPSMHIVIVAGNHDSARGLTAHNGVWKLLNTSIVGIPPAVSDRSTDWKDRYVLALPAGYIVMLPYMTSARQATLQELLDYVGELNRDTQLPVVMTGHLAVGGSDFTGHELGTLTTQDIASLGKGYDYLALGHIHRPQTLGSGAFDIPGVVAEYPSPVARYSGSALHVSCDETYPHSVSVVEIDRHEGKVRVRPLRIDQLRHFYTFPTDGSSFTSPEDALEAIHGFATEGGEGYIRFRFDAATPLPPDFSHKVYQLLDSCGTDLRYNPRHIFTDSGDTTDDAHETSPQFAVADLQQMTDPFRFVEKTIDNYPTLQLSIDELREMFDEIDSELNS